MATIDFYFDFLSPYSYLAHARLPELAKRYGYTISYRPIDLKSVKLAAGNDGPATAQIPFKLKYFMADMARWCERYELPFGFAKAPPVTARANKGVFFAQQRDQSEAYVTALWAATFGSAGEFNSDEVLCGVAEKLDWSADQFLAFVASDEAAKCYDGSMAEALEKGVFGAPTMMVGDEMWWGNDRLDFLEEYLAANPAK